MPGYEVWYEAFWHLSSTRQFFDGGASRISFTAISSYPGINPDELDFFASLIWELDKIWLNAYGQEVKAAVKGQKRKTSPRKVFDL